MFPTPRSRRLRDRNSPTCTLSQNGDGEKYPASIYLTEAQKLIASAAPCNGEWSHAKIFIQLMCASARAWGCERWAGLNSVSGLSPTTSLAPRLSWGGSDQIKLIWAGLDEIGFGENTSSFGWIRLDSIRLDQIKLYQIRFD